MAESKFLAGLALGSVVVVIAWLTRKKPSETPKPSSAELPSLTPEQAAPAPPPGASEALPPAPAPSAAPGASEASFPNPAPAPAPEPTAGAFVTKAAQPVYFDFNLDFTPKGE